uniref:Aa_trans domain-containing protein n=1 Tax=Syphacia muris TaxID=451379 RepID=A0A0N5AHX7_9BILA
MCSLLILAFGSICPYNLLSDRGANLLTVNSLILVPGYTVCIVVLFYQKNPFRRHKSTIASADSLRYIEFRYSVHINNC